MILGWENGRAIPARAESTMMCEFRNGTGCRGHRIALGVLVATSVVTTVLWCGDHRVPAQAGHSVSDGGEGGGHIPSDVTDAGAGGKVGSSLSLDEVRGRVRSLSQRMQKTLGTTVGSRYAHADPIRAQRRGQREAHRSGLYGTVTDPSVQTVDLRASADTEDRNVG